MKRYIARHINQGKYKSGCSISDTRFLSLSGWMDALITDSMIYSHRKTDYASADFDEIAHIHDHYELVIYVGGSVDFVTEGRIFSPTPVSVALFSPSAVHNTRLCTPSVYERYVFYFYPEIFDLSGRRLPFGDILDSTDGARVWDIPVDRQAELMHALGRLDSELSKGAPNMLVTYVRAMSVLDLVADISCMVTPDGESLPPKMLEIQEYIDRSYADISSVSEIAEHFFYSREYVSRMFKKYYNVSVSDYLARLRVIRAIELMGKGVSVTDAGFSVGFGSTSAFYLTFRRIMGMSPSEYVRRADRLKK